MPTGVYKRKPLSEETKRKIGIANSISLLGKKASPETKNKMSISRTGIKNHEWKENDVGYRGLHKWVERWLGKPSRCEHCGKIGYGRQIHWANKSQKYLRDLSDWLRLCVSCHTKYDQKLKEEALV